MVNSPSTDPRPGASSPRGDAAEVVLSVAGGDPRIEAVLRRIRDIPSLPEVVNKTIELLAKPNTPASQIAQLISYDPGLTSRVLRMTNSAAYGFQRQISSVQHGIMILGFNTVRGLVLSASIFKLFEAEGGKATPRGLDHRAFWQHSMATALVARTLADSLKLPAMDDAFSAGMLHDIGKIVLDVYFKQEYQRVLETAKLNKRPCHGYLFVEVEQAVMKTDHSEIGAYLAAKWKLPVPITTVISHHHKPAEAENCQPLVYLVALANELVRCHQLNFGVFSTEQFSPDVVAYFNLDEDRLQSLLQQCKADLDSIEELLAAISSKS